MRTGAILLLSTICALVMASAAHANGYDVYASPLAWSPNGQLLAAAVNISWPRDDTLADGVLRLYGRNGEVVAELAAGNCGSPSFSPDGKLLAAVVGGNLAIYEVATGKPWEGFKPAADSPALAGKVLDCIWLPNPNNKLGLVSYSAGERFYGCKAYAFDPAAGTEALLLNAGPGSALAAQTGPDQHFIVGLMQDADVTQGAAYERLVRQRGDEAVALVAKPQHRPDDYHESNVLFLDDHTVLFQRGGWGDWRLYRLDLATGVEYPELSDAQQPALDGSAKLLAYTRRDYKAKAAAEYDWDLPSSVRLHDRQTGQDWLASTPEVYAELPALTPDGARIAWLERGADGSAQVAIRTVAGTQKLGPGITPGSAVAPGRVQASAKEQTASTHPIEVTLETTKGPIILDVHPEWAPLAAEQFLKLVDAKFYDGAPWFRVLEGFVAQCGIAADPALNGEWGDKTIQDEVRTRSNTRGTVAFGKSSEPNSRSTHIFINYVDNSGALDGQDFAPFAEVVLGMENADKLARVEYNEQDKLAGKGGLADFQERFPQADYITSAHRGEPLEIDAASSAVQPQEPTMSEPTRVVLDTTKGKIVLAVHPDWAPIGAAHFLDLVKLGFYDGAPWFRVIDRKDPKNPDAKPVPFVAQCGIAADPALNKQWMEATIQDDPVVTGNTRGRIAYGKTDEPNSRSTHIYINFSDNSRLDAKGFAAFAEVVEGMEVADSLYRCEYEDQDKLAAEGGLADFKQLFPDADYILKAYVEDGIN